MGEEIQAGGDAADPPEGWWQASDGNYYPPEAEPDWSAVPVDSSPVFSPRQRRTLLLAVAAGLVTLLALGVGLLLLRNSGDSPPREGDLAGGEDHFLNIRQCPSEGGAWATGSIRNDTDQVVSFRIELPYVDAEDNVLVVESVVVEDLNPLEASRWQMAPAPDGTLDCSGARSQVFFETIRPTSEPS